MKTKSVSKNARGVFWISLLLAAWTASCRSGGDGSDRPAPDATETSESEKDPDIARGAAQGNATTPSVVSLVPSANAVSIGRDSNITVGFNVGLHAASATSAMSVHITGSPVAGTTSYDEANHTITFDPTSPLPANTLVTVQVAETVSVDGLVCPASSWSFTTAP